MTAFTDEHLSLLDAGAIPAEVAEAAGAYSVTRADGLPAGLRWDGPGLVFRYHPLEGDPVPQYRPDTPTPDGEGRAPKYLFPPGPVPINIVPAMRDRISTASRVLVVEGTKQTLAAVAHAPVDVVVVGIAGCWGWSVDGMGHPDLAKLCANKTVVVAFDADVAANVKVHQAGERLAKHLEVIGAEKVLFVKLPASGSVGLDDYLGSVPDPSTVLSNLLAKAGALPKRPKASGVDGAQFFDSTGLRVVDLVAAIRESGHYAVARDGSIWKYENGVYRDNDPVVAALRHHIGNRYRDQHLRNVTAVLADELRHDDLVIGDQETPGLINLRNGMLRVATGELEDHDPGHLSRTQIPMDWTPGAACPEFDRWLADRCGSQSEGLLEAAGLMLCPWIGQRRTVFLFGPTRSGKSTFLRLVEAIAGDHKAAVTLHQLATNRFSAASLYGKLLNVAGDLSDHHIDDLSLFKQLTGDDLVAGERKFRDPFTFRNKALFIFSANTPPTVSETSRGYLARVAPFLFPKSVEGNEDTGLDARLAAELPGVLVRLVEGAQRWLARGGYAPGDPMVADEFAQQSDVAALFASQVIAADPGGFTTGKAMFEIYREWAEANGRSRLGRNKFLARLENTLGPRERMADGATGSTGWRNIRALPADQWIDADPSARSARFLTTSLHEEISGEERGEGVVPREEEVGPKRAERAEAESVAVTVPAEDFIEELF